MRLILLVAKMVRIFNNMWRYNIVFLFIISTCWHAYAQDVVFSASPSANRIGIKDVVQVTFRINHGNITTMGPTGWGDFVAVQGPFQSSQTSISNGAVSQSISLTYVLQPKHEGKITIPPATATDREGHTYQSNPITIEVVAGSLAPQQQRRGRDPFGDEDDPFAAIQKMQQQMQQRMQQMQQMQQSQQAPQAQNGRQQPGQNDPPVDMDAIKKDVFIKVTVDKSKVKLGEQVTASYKLYSRIPMQMGISKLPSLNGFWTQDFEIPHMPKPTEEVYDGKKYQVFLLKKSALFPQQPGTLELDPAEAKGNVRIVQRVKRRLSDMMDPFGNGTLMMNDPFFNNAVYNTMAYRDVEVTLESTPVKITVTGLPDKDKPADYGGAVGDFTIASKLDKTELTTDDAATLTFNITGSGNLKLFEAPKVTLPNGLVTFEPQITDTITGRSTTISGSKLVTYVITPQTPGDYEIPAASFSYFNPETGSYTTLHTTPMKLHVTAGKHYNPSVTNTNTGKTLAIKDIHENIDSPSKPLTFQSSPMLFSPGYWSVYLVLMLALVGWIGYGKYVEHQLKDTVSLRSKRANKVALQRLVTAKKLMQQNKPTQFFEEVSKATWLYLSDKLNIPLSVLSKDAANEALSGKKVPESLQKDLDTVMWECETALYASGGSQKMGQVYDSAVNVIGNLEDYIKA